MFDSVSVILILFFFNTISGQLPRSGYAKYGRNPPSFIQRSEKDLNRQPLLDLQGGDNVQKLVIKRLQYFDKETDVVDDENNLGPDGPALSGSFKKKNIDEETVAPQNVNRVQEMTGQLWPMGVIPFFVDKEAYDGTTINRIIKAMGVIESVSCVIFKELEQKPKNSPDAWLHITNPRQERECVHVFSTVGGGTELILGFDCLHPEEILHSLLHGLGFRDEVVHPHRDQYIRVLWDNIQPKYRELFRIHHEDDSYKLVEYDPMSIMHFHDRAFSENGAATIAAIIPGLHIASSTSLSQLDIMRLNLAFSHECNRRNIGDLLITCKNSMAKPEKPQNVPDEDQSPEDDGHADEDAPEQLDEKEDGNNGSGEEHHSEARVSSETSKQVKIDEPVDISVEMEVKDPEDDKHPDEAEPEEDQKVIPIDEQNALAVCSSVVDSLEKKSNFEVSPVGSKTFKNVKIDEPVQISVEIEVNSDEYQNNSPKKQEMRKIADAGMGGTTNGDFKRIPNMFKSYNTKNRG